MTRYEIVPERSEIHVEGSSSVHGIHGHADGATGFVEFDADGRLVAGRLEVDAERLRWGNPLLDGETRRRIDTARHPTIVGELSELDAPPARAAGLLRAHGSITFHGVTHPVEGEVTVSEPTPGTVLVEGEQTFDVRDWDLQPPRLLLLKVSPEIRVRIRIEAVAAR